MNSCGFRVHRLAGPSVVEEGSAIACEITSSSRGMLRRRGSRSGTGKVISANGICLIIIIITIIIMMMRDRV